MKNKRKNIEDLGFFNILFVGDNPHAISIADNTHAFFYEQLMDGGYFDAKFKCDFNIVEDIEKYSPSNSWFNEFIFEMTTMSCYNNIIVSKQFYDWSLNAPKMERIYMKKLLQAMNTVIIDISKETDLPIFDEDIPQYKFNINTDVIGDSCKWIESQIEKIIPLISNIRLIRSFAGNSLPYLGDVFGCLSGKSYKGIIKADKMRFNVPILFDEFCSIVHGRTMEEIEGCAITRTSSALSMFFK